MTTRRKPTRAKQLGVTGMKRERDALRAFIERIARLNPDLGPMDVHTLVADAKQLLKQGE